MYTVPVLRSDLLCTGTSKGKYALNHDKKQGSIPKNYSSKTHTHPHVLMYVYAHSSIMLPTHLERRGGGEREKERERERERDLHFASAISLLTAALMSLTPPWISAWVSMYSYTSRSASSAVPFCSQYNHLDTL